MLFGHLIFSMWIQTNSSLICLFISLFKLDPAIYSLTNFKATQGLQRLQFLEEACGIDLQYPKSQQPSMAKIQTSFGVVKINGYGKVTVDKTVWNRFQK